MNTPITPRDTVLGARALAACAGLATETASAGRPDVPPSALNAESTAEEVTAGLTLTGKTILLTGVNSGIGCETVRVLAMRGVHIIGSARTQDKAQTTCNSIKSKTTPLVCELTDFEGIEFDNLSGTHDYDPRRADSQSKLANILFARRSKAKCAE